VSRLLSYLIVITGLSTAALIATAAPGAPTQEVTLRAERFWDDATRSYRFRFSGTIPSNATNEYVAVLQQKCGQGSGNGTAIAGASTRQGGFWEAPPVGALRPEFDSSTYRARWRGRLSAPLEFRAKLTTSLTRLSGGRYRVNVSTLSTGQNMSGRLVELQRLEDGQWTDVQRGRLVGSRTTFRATFMVRTAGLTLRAFVPEESASPCYVATPTETWVSEEPTPLGSAASVVDRTILCSTALRGGIRQISIQAHAQGTGLTVQSPTTRLAAVFPSLVELSPRACTRTRARVRLTAEKLKRRTTGPLGRQFDCAVPPRVVIRVRAMFHVPTVFESGRPWGYPALTAEGEVREAALAIRTRAGRPLAFATVTESGNVRLFTARHCAKDTIPG
jgi:hypothetical protein